MDNKNEMHSCREFISWYIQMKSSINERKIFHRYDMGQNLSSIFQFLLFSPLVSTFCIGANVV